MYEISTSLKGNNRSQCKRKIVEFVSEVVKIRQTKLTLMSNTVTSYLPDSINWRHNTLPTKPAPVIYTYTHRD